MPAADTIIRNKVEYDTKNSEKNIGSLEGKLKKLISAAALAFATKKIFEFGQAFETSFAKASTLIDGAVVDLEGLEGQILDLSKSSGIAADELNESLYQALSAGVPITEDGADSMAFLERNIKLAKGGFTDLTTAVDVTTTVINAYGKEINEIDQITDILIKTQNAGKTTVDELGSSLAAVIPIASAMNVEFEQVGSGMAALTAQGVPTAQAATQLRAVFSELGKAGTKSSKVLKELSGKSFQELMSEGRSVSDVLVMMEKHAKDNNLSLIDLFGSIEAGQGALGLTGEGAIKFNDTMKTMRDGVDATSEAFDIMSSTTSEQMNIALNELKIVATQLFLAIAPLILSVLEFINANELLIPILGTLASVLGLVKVAQIAMNIAMLANPIGLIIVAIAALIGIGVLLVKNWDKVRSFFVKVWDEISKMFFEGVNGIIDIINGLVSVLNLIPGVDIPLTAKYETSGALPALASGGLAFGETTALIGDNMNARTDPEVVAPLSRLEGMFNMGGSQGPQIIQLTMDGRKISETVIGRTNNVMSGSFGVKPN